MKCTFSVSQVSGDIWQPGRWWVQLPLGSRQGPEWVDCLAAEARQRNFGHVAVLDAEAILISNLRVWENMILPLWYREGGMLTKLEAQAQRILALAGLSEEVQTTLMTRQPSALDRSERRLIILLRALLLEPRCVIVEEAYWRDMENREQDTAHALAWCAMQSVECMIVVGEGEAPAGWMSATVKEEY